jgi:hypothetical protein
MPPAVLVDLDLEAFGHARLLAIFWVLQCEQGIPAAPQSQA